MPTRLLLLGLLLLAGCHTPSATPVNQNWTDADKIGTMPDFYEKVPANLLIISVDTFRRDHVGFLGGGDLTPNLDRLAKAGVTLATHTQCSNWTFASMTCTMRGGLNVENGFIPRLAEATRLPLPDSADFFAEWMVDAGFYAALSTGNSWFGRQWNNGQGYDIVTGEKFNAYTLGTNALAHLEREIATGTVDRWVLHMHTMEPHAPYIPPDEYRIGEDQLEPLPKAIDLDDKDVHYDYLNKYRDMSEEEQALLEAHLRVRYEGEIRWWDDQLMQILADADSRGLLDDTLVLIFNDHGEQFWEHGFQTHAYTLFREENDAFAILWSPNIVAMEWTEPTVSIDLVPTLLQLYDIEIPDVVTGVPLGERDPSAPRYATSVARLGALQSVRLDQYKMNFNWSGVVRVFDLEADPNEENDLYDPDDPVTLELWSYMEPYAEMADPLVNEYPLNLPAALTD